MICIKD